MTHVTKDQAIIHKVRRAQRLASGKNATESQHLKAIGSGAMAEDEVIRFRSSTAMSYPTAATDSDPRRSQEPKPAAIPARGLRKKDHSETLWLTSEGFSGYRGILPRHIGDDIQRQLQEDGRSTIAEFLDVMYHRLTTIRLTSQMQSNLGLEAEQTDERDIRKPSVAKILQRIACRPEHGEFAYATRCFAFLCRKPNPSTADIARLLAVVLGKRVDVQAMYGEWLPLAQQHRATTSKNGPALGRGAILGRRIFSAQHALGLKIGPITAAESQDYLHGNLLDTVHRMMAQLTGKSFTLHVTLELIFENHQTARWEGHSSAAMKLGIGAVLGGRASDNDTFTYTMTRHRTLK